MDRFTNLAPEYPVMSQTDQSEGLKSRIKNQIIKATVDSSDVVTKSATKEEMREDSSSN